MPAQLSPKRQSELSKVLTAPLSKGKIPESGPRGSTPPRGCPSEGLFVGRRKIIGQQTHSSSHGQGQAQVEFKDIAHHNQV